MPDETETEKVVTVATTKPKYFEVAAAVGAKKIRRLYEKVWVLLCVCVVSGLAGVALCVNLFYLLCVFQSKRNPVKLQTEMDAFFKPRDGTDKVNQL